MEKRKYLKTKEGEKSDFFILDKKMFFDYDPGCEADCSSEIKEANIASFTPLSIGLAKDNKNAYFQSNIIKSVNTSKIKVIGGNYWKDDKNIFHESSKIEADIGSFTILNKYYAKDKNCIFKFGRKLDTDVTSFKIKSDKVAYDKSKVFYENITIQGADGKSFEIVKHPYSKDKNNVYHIDKIVPKADGPTFEYFDEIEDHQYFKDKNKVFYHPLLKFIDKPDDGLIEIKGADPESFKLIKNKYSKDNNAAFFGFKKIIGLKDINSFKPLKYFYSTDGNHVFYDNICLFWKDPKNFKIEGNFRLSLKHIFYILINKFYVKFIQNR